MSIGAGCSAWIWLERVTVARYVGFAPHELGDILASVRNQRGEPLEAWHVHFETKPVG